MAALSEQFLTSAQVSRGAPVGTKRRGIRRRVLAPLLGLLLVPTWPVMARASASIVGIHSATVAETVAIEQAANAVSGCGFSSVTQYLWPLEVSSGGWAVGQVDARDPVDQGNGDLVMHLSGGQWQYVTCGSDFSTGQANANYPVSVVIQLQNAMPSPSTQPATSSMAKTLQTVTANWGWCPGSSQLWPVEVTNVGWAAGMLNGAPASGYCVVIYTHAPQGWRVFTYGTTPQVWNSLNVPDFVLVLLRSALMEAVATLEPPVVTEAFHTVQACNKSNTLGLGACGEQLVLTADKQLNADVTAIFGLLSIRGREDFIAAQKNWLSYRNADCQSQSDVYLGGTAQGVAYVYCLNTDDTLRHQALKSLFSSLTQNFGTKTPKFP